jgi:ribosome maturation factor RimP
LFFGSIIVGEKMPKRGGTSKAKAHKQTARGQSDPERLKRQRAFVEAAARLADPLCAAEGMELVHLEFQREPGGLTLRLYLDKPGGVTLEDCAQISRQLSDILDVQIQDAPPYRLEVSSPGLDRPLVKLADFDRFNGQRAKIRLAAAVNGRKNFTGVLVGVVGAIVQLQVESGMVGLPISDITRARLINYNGES